VAEMHSRSYGGPARGPRVIERDDDDYREQR